MLSSQIHLDFVSIEIVIVRNLRLSFLSNVGQIEEHSLIMRFFLPQILLGPTGETTSTSISAEKGKEKESETLTAGESDKTAVLAILARMGVTGGIDGANANGTSYVKLVVNYEDNTNHLSTFIRNLVSTSATTTVPTLQPPPAAPAPVEPNLVAQNPLALLQQLTQQNLLQNVPVAPPMNPANYFAPQLAALTAQSLAEHPYPTVPMYMPSNSLAPGVGRYQEERDDPRRPAHANKRHDSPPGGSAIRPSRGYDRAYEDGYGKMQRRDGAGAGGSRWDKPRRDQGRSRSRSPPARSDPRDPRLSSPSSRTQPIPTFTSAAEALSPPGSLRPIPSTIPNRTNGHNTEERIGLDSFDFSNFDATSAESWTSFGNAFEVTHGRQGTHEELINAMMELRNGAPILPGQAGVSQANGNYNNQYTQYTQFNQNEAYPMQLPANYLPPAQQINTWETREQDEMKRGGRQVGHGSYDGGGGTHAIGAGRWQQSDAIVLCGSDE